MNPADNIEKLVKKLRYQSSDQTRKKILDNVAAVLESKKKRKPALIKPNIWRQIMKSKTVKLTAAAVIIVAALIGINHLGGSIDGTTVALADVAKKLEQLNNCVFKKTTSITSGSNTSTFDSLVYYGESNIREDIFNNEKMIIHVYVKFLEKTVVGIDHTLKEFKKTDLTDEDIEMLSPMSPKNIVSLFLSKGEFKKLGRKVIDGIVSDGFEFYDKRTMLSMDKDKIKKVTVRLWVDVSTDLPVRVELDGVLANDSIGSVVMYDPEWDIDLPLDFFEPAIPGDYVTLEQRGFIGVNLENWPSLKVVPGSAAENAGIKNGDVVLKIDNNSVSDIKSSDEARNLLLGKVGEKAILTVKRGDQILTFEIERMPAADYKK